jgi:hypothetical protein
MQTKGESPEWITPRLQGSEQQPTPSWATAPLHPILASSHWIPRAFGLGTSAPTAAVLPPFNTVRPLLPRTLRASASLTTRYRAIVPACLCSPLNASTVCASLRRSEKPLRRARSRRLNTRLQLTALPVRDGTTLWRSSAHEHHTTPTMEFPSVSVIKLNLRFEECVSIYIMELASYVHGATAEDRIPSARTPSLRSVFCVYFCGSAESFILSSLLSSAPCLARWRCLAALRSPLCSLAASPNLV